MESNINADKSKSQITTMKDDFNLKFERNNYYPGKNLFTEDFFTEQEYFNNKRRLINMMNLGSGILYGLEVPEYDMSEVPESRGSRWEDEFLITPGVAIDLMGREITVPEVENVVLTSLEGLPEPEKLCIGTARYICLEYREEGKEKTRENFNRTLEKSQITLEADPYTFLTDIDKILYEITELYKGEGVLIWSKSPRYVNSEKPFMCSIMLIKLKKDVRVKLDYKIQLENLEALSESVAFENIDKIHPSECEYTYTVRAGNDDGSILFKDMKLEIDGRSVPVYKKVSVSVIKEPLTEKLMREYSRENIYQRFSNRRKNKICLAKIFINNIPSKIGTKCNIGQVENSIFRRYVYPQFLQVPAASENNKKVKEEPPEQTAKPNTGTGYIKIPVEHVYKKVHFTENIPHRLGPGPVMITTGLEEQEGIIFSGDMELFNKSEAAPKVRNISIGVMQDLKRGSFKLGVCIKDSHLTKGEIVIRWWARLLENT